MKNEKAMFEMARADDMASNLEGLARTIVVGLMHDSDYDELGIAISALTHALEARLIEDGENPDVDNTKVNYTSPNFGPQRIRTVTITKAYWDWVRQVATFISHECDKNPITPRAKRSHVLNTLIIMGLTLHRDVVELPDIPVKYQILNKTGTFLPILMMYSFEHKLPFKISNFIKEVKI